MSIANAVNFTGLERYVVDSNPARGNYTTVQSAIDAASLVGNATIWINPGVYTEDLVFSVCNFSICGNTSQKSQLVTISGNHTFTNWMGGCSFQDLNFSNVAGDLFTITSDQASSSSVQFSGCEMNSAAKCCVITSVAPATFQVNFESSYLQGATGCIVLDGPTQSNFNYGGLNCVSGFCIDVDNGAQASPFTSSVVSGSGSGAVIRDAVCQVTCLHCFGAYGAEFVQFLAAGTCIVAFMGFSSGAASYWATGTGTLIYGGVGLATGQMVDPLITQIPLGLQPFATSGITATAVRGTSAFDSTSFAVSSTGFVTFTGSGSLPATAITSSQALAVDNRYYVTSGALSLSLPSTSSVGSIIEVTLAPTGTSFEITQGAGQQITLGLSSSTSGVTGSVASSATGDSLRLECVVADLSWQAVGGFTGAFTVS